MKTHQLIGALLMLAGGTLMYVGYSSPLMLVGVLVLLVGLGVFDPTLLAP